MKHLSKIQTEFAKIAGKFVKIAGKLNLQMEVQLTNGEKGYIEMPKSSFDMLSDDATVEVWFPNKLTKKSFRFTPKKFQKKYLKLSKESYNNKEVKDESKTIKDPKSGETSAFKNPKDKKMFSNQILDLIDDDVTDLRDISEKLHIIGWKRLPFGSQFISMIKGCGFDVVGDTVSKGAAVKQIGLNEINLDWWRHLAPRRRQQYLYRHPFSKYKNI